MSEPASTATESIIAMVAKSIPPVSVSTATLIGIPVSDLVLWGTLIYTVLMIGHKLFAIYKDISKEAWDD